MDLASSTQDSIYVYSTFREVLLFFNAPIYVPDGYDHIGVGLHPMKRITLVSKVKYGKYYIGATWPLGSAIEALSTKKQIQDQ
jgi:hypothetical protein